MNDTVRKYGFPMGIILVIVALLAVAAMPQQGNLSPQVNVPTFNAPTQEQVTTGTTNDPSQINTAGQESTMAQMGVNQLKSTWARDEVSNGVTTVFNDEFTSVNLALYRGSSGGSSGGLTMEAENLDRVPREVIITLTDLLPADGYMAFGGPELARKVTLVPGQSTLVEMPSGIYPTALKKFSINVKYT